MSRYGRESEKQVFSYMDNVPVKISEQFKPPRKVTLPVSFRHRLSNENITGEYDFRLEKSVLEKMEEWRKLRKLTVENRTERIKDLERASAKLKDNAVATTSQSSVSPVPSRFSAVESSGGSYPTSSDSNISYPKPTPIFTQPVTCAASTLTPALQNISFSNSGTTSTPQYSILTPVPIAPASTYPVINKASAHFNFSDFEADTSSPFDNMELKTINDMEELAHVLQPLSNHGSQIKQKPPDSTESLKNIYSTPVSIYDVDQVALCNTFDSKLKKDSHVHAHINGLTGYGLYSTGPRIKQHGINRNDGFSPYGYSPGMSVKPENSYNYYSERTWSAGITAGPEYSLNPSNRSNDTVTSQTSDITCSSVHQPGYTTIQHPPLTYGASFPSTCNSNQDQHSPGRSLSKSVPDIVQELEKELKNKQTEEAISAGRTSHTPPPRPNSFGSTGLENWKPWPDLDSPPRGKTPSPSSSSHPAVKVPPRSKLPNPFWNLNKNAQALVKHISEMGFALPRVARACQLLGEDDKKIVEYLLQVQSLEEKSYPGDRVEKALIVNRYNSEHAIKYLDALTQLLDLGFPEDQVSDALVMFNNDRDKALDKLIS
ncbi:hypothetical protein L9F63_019895 [Diploptera punctata]|uniref:Ubiquitin-associated protein 1 n=1 Tax=Diploptera punctata TaxID=6984 RepID=A0AAD7ZUR7_DIPPU|nr:hypothetical protein L9F63_019895 [Diploptera punctata]